MSWWGEDRCDRLAIVGLGQIGSSVGLAAREACAAWSVVGYDLDPATAAEALGLGAVTELATSAEEAAQRSDLVVLAAPVLETVRQVAEVAPHLGPRCILTDVGSVKGPVVEALDRSAACRGRGVGGHPMAGGERPGPAAARADLFHGCRWVLCPGPNTRADVLHTVRHFVSLLGAVPLIMSAADHDREVAFTSHLPYLTAISTCLALRAQRADAASWALAGSGLRDCTRVAGCSPEMTASFCLANRLELTRALQSQSTWLARLAAVLAESDQPALEAMLREGRDWRQGVGFAAAGSGAR